MGEKSSTCIDSFCAGRKTTSQPVLRGGKILQLGENCYTKTILSFVASLIESFSLALILNSYFFNFAIPVNLLLVLIYL